MIHLHLPKIYVLSKNISSLHILCETSIFNIMNHLNYFKAFLNHMKIIISGGCTHRGEDRADKQVE